MNAMPDQFCMAFPMQKRKYMQYRTMWVDTASQRVIVKTSSSCSATGVDYGDLMLCLDVYGNRRLGTRGNNFTIKDRSSRANVSNRLLEAASNLKARDKSFISDGKTREEEVVPAVYQRITFPSGTPIRFTPVRINFFTGMPVWGDAHSHQEGVAYALLENRDLFGVEYTYYTEVFYAKQGADGIRRLYDECFQTLSTSQCVYVLKQNREYAFQINPNQPRRLAAVFSDACRFDQDVRNLLESTGFDPMAEAQKQQTLYARAAKSAARYLRRSKDISTRTRSFLQMLAAATLSPHGGVRGLTVTSE